MLFKNRYLMTEEIFVNQNSLSKWHYCWTILFALLAFIFILVRKWLMAAIMISFTIYIICLVYNSKKKAMKKYQGFLNSDNPQNLEIVIEFHKNNVEICWQNSRRYLDYGSITGSHKVGNIIVFKTDRKDRFSIKTDSFEVGNMRDFDTFLSVKGFKTNAI